MEASNPYAAPQSESKVDPVSLSALGELVKGWEKLRLIYNAVLFPAGLALMAYFVVSHQMTVGAACLFALASGIAANSAFFLGPLTELYFRAIFNRGEETPMLRRSLLILGLLVSYGAMLICTLGIMFT